MPLRKKFLLLARVHISMNIQRFRINLRIYTTITPKIVLHDR